MGMQFNKLVKALIAGGITQQYMIEGMNLAPRGSWTGMVTYANICHHLELFTRKVGSGSYTQDHGILNASVGTDEFNACIGDTPYAFPSGTYSVYNPEGANIAFGDFSSPTAHSGAYTTSTSFSFTYAGTGRLFLWVKGSLTNAIGNLVVLLPGVTKASYDAGNIWNPAYLSFRAGLGKGVMRMMDWDNASSSIETDWADRTVANKISLSNPIGASTPIEFKLDLANKLGTDLWICVPTRATSDYVTQLATAIKNGLNPGLRVWLELGNEVWNTNGAWAAGTNWVTYLDFTKYTAVANYGANTFTKVGHGLSEDQVIHGFTTKANAAAGMSAGGENWRMIRGVSVYVHVLTADTFSLKISYGGAALPVALNQTEMIYCTDVEAGKTADQDGNYGRLSLRNWDIADNIIGVNNYNRMIVRHSGNVSTLTGALGVTGVPERTSYVSSAPYIYSYFWAGDVSISSGTFTPKVWSSEAKTIHIAVYSEGVNPTEAEIISGTGAINKQSISATIGTSSWQSATAVTGLTNGTSYKVYFLVADTKKNWISSQTLVASATASEVYFYDSNANQAQRDREATKTGSLVAASTWLSAAGNIPMFCYEGGYHNQPASYVSQVMTWLNGTYQESDDFAGVMLDNLYRLASIGIKGHCYYCETAGGNTFTIANTITDVTDKRYLALAGLSGRVAVQPVLSISNILGAPIPTAPTVPYVIATLPGEVGRTYALVGGNSANDMDIVGNDLRLTSTAAVNWGSPSTKYAYLEAFRGNLSEQFTVQFTTGSAWYEGDSNFAWSTITDTDTAAITPIYGSAIAGTGTAAIRTSYTDKDGLTDKFLWTMQTDTKYTGSSAIASIPASGTPFLFAFVMDKNTQGTSYVTLASIGIGAAYIKFAMDGTNLTLNTWFGTTLATNIQTIATVPTGAHVHWVYGDGGSSPTFHIGRDQTSITTLAPPAASGQSFGPTRTLGNGSGVTAKLGSMQTVSRVGMTLADAKAIVAKMQAHHGIA